MRGLIVRRVQAWYFEDMTFSFVDIGGRRYAHDREPSECPICHVAVQPEDKDWTLTDSEEGQKQLLEIVFRCPRRECGHFFIARYKRSDVITPPAIPGLGSGIGNFLLYETTPTTPIAPNIPDEIKNVSPLFAEIYAQALAAESCGLNQVAGVGYRKALEFLVKDYCISANPQLQAQIRSAYLATCIKQYVASPEVKICAERAAWLGNDETHYERRWADKDMTNLKELIVLALNWMHSSILTQKYLKEMPR